MTQLVQPSVDLKSVKARQQAAWASGRVPARSVGDAVIGTTLVIVGELLCEAVDLRAGQRVLDVATGHGITALAAARRGGDVIESALHHRVLVLPGARLTLCGRRVAASGRRSSD